MCAINVLLKDCKKHKKTKSHMDAVDIMTWSKQKTKSGGAAKGTEGTEESKEGSPPRQRARRAGTTPDAHRQRPRIPPANASSSAERSDRGSPPRKAPRTYASDSQSE